MKLSTNTRYRVECFDKSGVLRWIEDFHNIVTTQGLNKLLDASFKTGLASPAWFIGLIDGATATFAAADTHASHAGWVEFVEYEDGTRQAFVLGTIAAGSVDNTASRAVFHIDGIGDGDRHVYGLFLSDDDTKGGTDSGHILYGEAMFSGGQRPVNDGDILRVAGNVQVVAD